MELDPISASLGAMGFFTWKLDELLATRHRALKRAVKDEIEQLRTELHIIHTLLLKLSEAQDPPLTARYWMKDVRELSYDMEDCVDHFVHADARAKVRRATCRKITRLKISRLPEMWRPWITKKISEFRTRAQEATQRYWRYKFDDCASNPGYSRVGHELPALYAEPGDLVGMEGPMNELDRWLTSEEEQLKVVSIVGVGGVGKTTLAQNLWGKLQGQFDCRAFVRTAQKPDMRGILRSILFQVRWRQPLPEPGEMHHLIHDLREYLQDKRYFVIIDDLWAASVWDVVSRAFPEGNRCSRIITTTEIVEVALACCGYCPKHILKVEPLSDDDSEKLFLQRIQVSRNQSPAQFDDVLSQITRKCGGLPLAIIMVASLLARQPEKLEQWGCVQNSFGSNLWANPTMEGFMGQILNLSFNSLPHYLKTCLLYLSTYPEGYIFLKDDLVKQWVAEGFICAKEEEDMEEVAGSYFDKLASTGLIQVMDVNYNYELSYSVHPMVFDLITYKSIEENFITVVDYSQTTIPLADKVRRLSLHFGSATYATMPASTRFSQVRSLFFFGLFNCMPSFVVFKLLRVLILHFWGDLGNTSFDLTGICDLFWLRYLQVTCNLTVKLPDNIEAMQHLETLEINARVCAVPPDIVRLSSLLHLCLLGGTNLPDGIGCMRSLRTLKYFDLAINSEDNLWGLGVLTNLQNLNITFSTSPSSEILKRNLIALASSLGKLGNLRSLTLAPGTADTVVLIDSLSVMSSAPVFLERLELLPPICIFSRLPKWFGELHRLCILKVAVRELLMNDIDSLTGLPSLTVLSLCVQTAPEGRIIFNDGAFPVLKYFKFRCGVLCLAFMAGAMPNLRRLKLCFNTHIGEKYSSMLAGIGHLLNLQDVAGRIGRATGADDSDRKAAESMFKDAISKHPRCPRINVQWVDLVKEECPPSEEQHRRQEKGSSGEKYGVLEKAEDTNKHADSGMSQICDLTSIAALRRMKSEKTAEASKHLVLKSMICDESAAPDILDQMMAHSKAPFQQLVEGSKTSTSLLLRTKIVIKVDMPGKKERSKALRLAAQTRGVASAAAFAGDGKDQLVLVGEGIELAGLVTRLRKRGLGASIMLVEDVKSKLAGEDELMPLSQSLITPDLAVAFDIPTHGGGSGGGGGGGGGPGGLGGVDGAGDAGAPEMNGGASSAAGSSGGGGGSAGEEPARTLKRPRLVWTPQLHKRFVAAVAHLGIKNAVPRTIMQLMSVDGLTRENVASHLQKYRLYLKRMQGLGNRGGGAGAGGGAGGSHSSGSGIDAATEHLSATGPSRSSKLAGEDVTSKPGPVPIWSPAVLRSSDFNWFPNSPVFTD